MVCPPLWSATSMVCPPLSSAMSISCLSTLWSVYPYLPLGVCLHLWSVYLCLPPWSAYRYGLPTSTAYLPLLSAYSFGLPISVVYLPLWSAYLYGLPTSVVCLPLLLLHPFAVYTVSPVSKVNWAAALSLFGQTVRLRLFITSKVCLPLPNLLRSAYLHGLTSR